MSFFIFFFSVPSVISCIFLMFVLAFTDLFKTAKAKFKNINIVVNNAGIMHEGLWEKTVDINLVIYFDLLTRWLTHVLLVPSVQMTLMRRSLDVTGLLGISGEKKTSGQNHINVQRRDVESTLMQRCLKFMFLTGICICTFPILYNHRNTVVFTLWRQINLDKTCFPRHVQGELMPF